MIKHFLILLCVSLFATFACKDNSVNLEPAGQRGEVSGSWIPLQENDTLEVYVNSENKIHLGDPAFDITLILEAHISTFQVWTGSNYARDSLNVYFPIEIECAVIEEIYTCYSTKYIIEGVRAISFRYLGNGYGTDGNELFLNGLKVQGNNGEGF